MYFDDKQLVGYIGISSFGGTDTTLEITGMVHPDYRRQGIFLALHDLVMSECKRRNAERILLLCDRNSVSGQEFLKRIGAVYQNSEYEMYLHAVPNEMGEERLTDLSFRKATNADADEIARQNAIYFGDREAIENNEIKSEGVILPEDEERRGMSIYLAEMDKQVIGKVHLQINNDIGGIFGLGVLPEMRKMGLGRTILIKAIAMLKDAKAREIMLQVATGNTSALGLYKSCGFRETSIMDYYELL
jgi:ribosomal protein S18 acetylase RimI-like enzyme